MNIEFVFYNTESLFTRVEGDAHMIDMSWKHSKMVPHKHGLTTVTLIEYPGADDWMAVKRRALITIGKYAVTAPSSEWITRILDARHSPIRRAMYSFEFGGIPSNTSTHFARHVHAQPYVSTLRSDRISATDLQSALGDLCDAVDGDLAPRCTPVSMILDVNAEALMIMANKRLCSKAAEITRSIMRAMCDLVIEVTPEMKRFLVPACVYNGGMCHEFESCGMHPHY